MTPGDGPPRGGRYPKGPLRAGEDVILVDPKGEEKLLTLCPGKPFGTHKGNLLHDDIIGKPDGSRVWTAMGTEFRVFRQIYSQMRERKKKRSSSGSMAGLGGTLLGRTAIHGSPGNCGVCPRSLNSLVTLLVATV